MATVSATLTQSYTVPLLSTTPPVTAGFAAAGLPVKELPIHDTGCAVRRDGKLLGHVDHAFFRTR